MALTNSEFGSTPAATSRHHQYVLLLLSLVVLLLGLLPRELWGTNEAIVAAIVREMLVDGEWLVPHLNQQLYPDKPPLYYWLSAALSLVSGTLTPLWLRLPATLAAIGCLWLTYAFGTLLRERSVGLLAALILITSPLFTISAQIARQDMLITFLTLAILYCFVRGYLHASGPRWWFLAIYPLAGLSFLTKGLIGPVVPALIIVIFVICQREWRLLLRMQIGWGLLLAGAVVLPWLIPAVVQEGPGYASDLLIKQSVGRAVDSFAHDRPFYYYLWTFPPTFLPWIAFLPGAFWVMWRRRDRGDWRTSLLTAWTVGLFLFFSAVSGKLIIYLLPLFPGFALVIASYWKNTSDTHDTSIARRRLFWPSLLVVTLLVAGAVIVALSDRLPLQLPTGMLLGYAGIVVVITVIGVAVRQVALPARIFGVVLISISLALVGAKLVTGNIDETQSPKSLGQQLKQYSRTYEVMGIYRVRRGLLNYYADRHFEELTSLAALREFFRRPEPVLCVIQDTRFENIRDRLPADLHLIGQGKVGKRTYLMVANAPRSP